MAADGQEPGSLGVSALLDELLAEQELAAGSQVEDEDVGREAFSPPAQGTIEPSNDELAELVGEMDSCLASLDNWEAECRRDQEELKRQLEAQYGFSYEEALRSHGANTSCDLHDVDGCDDADATTDEMYGSAQLIDSLPVGVRAAPAGRGAPDARQQDFLAEAPMPLAFDGAIRRPDDERLAKLRAEVEALRQKEAQMALLASSGPLDEPLSPSSPIGGIAAWCNEVDEMLGFETGIAGNSLDALESQLAVAEARASLMQEGLDDARSRIDAELKDLDAMLSECDALQAKMHEEEGLAAT